MGKIKWGVLGYARIAESSFIPGVIKASNSELYAVASRDPAKLRQCRQKFHCPKSYNNYDELIMDPEVQAVYIPLPNDLHREWTIKAARRGKHVLCEKPLALNTAECREMIAECGRYNVKLMEAFMYRYSDRTQKVIRVLNSGILGEIKYINSSFRFHLQKEDDYRWNLAQGGGSLLDVGCYPVNFIGLVTGDFPVAMAAEYGLRNGVDEIFSAILKYRNGAIATVNCGFNAFAHVHSEIVGTKGALEVPDTFFGNAGSIAVTSDAGREEIAVMECDRYQLEIEDFAAAILNGRQPLLALEESVRNMEIIDQLLGMIDRSG